MTVTVHHGDCREVLATLAEASVDSVVCDPPYHLTSIVKRFGSPDAAPAKEGATGAYARASRGFMGKTWDGGDVAFQPETWAAVLRVMKPGAHLVAFGGTRTYHRMACAIEDAGFEVRDAIMWHYGSGFPKSHNVKKRAGPAVCRCSAGVDSMPGLRDAEEDSSCMAQEEQGRILQSVVSLESGLRAEPDEARSQGTSWLDGGVQGKRSTQDDGRLESSMEGWGDLSEATRQLSERALCALPAGFDDDGAPRRLCDGASIGHGSSNRPPASADRSSASRRSPAAQQCSEQLGTVAVQSQPQAGGAWPRCDRCGKPNLPDGLGTALKPATEIIILARKPFRGTVAANVLEHGTGAINVDGCRIGETVETWPSSRARPADGFPNALYTHKLAGQSETKTVPTGDSPPGRWPANLCHDGSDEVLQAFPAESGGGFGARGTSPNWGPASKQGGTMQAVGFGDSGSAARFFFSAKADASDRLGSKHPTVKPVDLMRWLVRLVTPKAGLVLDPFAGTGTTGMAALMEGMRAVLIEREAEYVADINRRLAHMKGGDAPLFAEHAPPLQRPGRRIYGLFADERSDRQD